MKNNIFNKLLDKLNHTNEEKSEVSSTSSTNTDIILLSEKIRDDYIETPGYVRTHIGTQQSHILASLFDMAYVAATAEDAFVLPQPIKFAIAGKKSDTQAQKYESDMEFTNRHFQKNLKTGQLLNDRVESRIVLFEMIREVYPDFASNYTEKMSPQDLEIYLETKKLFKKHIGVQQPPVYNDETTSEEILSKYSDSISEVIDTQQFSRACQIEDSFMLRELDIFFEKYDELSAEDRQKFTTTKIPTSKGNSVTAIKLAHLLRDSRIARLEKYSQIESLYKKMESHPFIKLDIEEKDDERFYHR